MTVAVVATALFMSSCNNNDPATPGEARTYHVSIKASKGTDTPANGPRRALSDPGDGTLTATWAAGDEVKVYLWDTYLGTLTAQSAGANTTLSGDLTGEFQVNDNLTLYYHGELDYTGQVGTLQDISDNHDFASATVTIASIDGTTITTTEDAVFANSQTIVKFTLQNTDGDPLYASSLTITSDYGMTLTIDPAHPENNTGGDLVIDPDDDTDEIWAAMYVSKGMGGIDYPFVNLKLTATVGLSTFEYTKSGETTLAAGGFYRITVKMSPAVAPSSLPDGALSGLFSVSDTKQVYFSQGNLQYSGSAYQFATNQWDYLGTASGATYDLFQWHDSSSDLGKNAITNGGNTANAGWRTLTMDEWTYLKNHASSGACRVHGVDGYILAPDDYLGYMGGAAENFDEWEINDSYWDYYASQGCIFIPQGTGYWSVTESDEDNAYKLRIVSEGSIYREMTTDAKTAGNCVRLVIDAN